MACGPDPVNGANSANPANPSGGSNAFSQQAHIAFQRLDQPVQPAI
jgi:hypothetical protein